MAHPLSVVVPQLPLAGWKLADLLPCVSWHRDRPVSASASALGSAPDAAPIAPGAGSRRSVDVWEPVGGVVSALMRDRVLESNPDAGNVNRSCGAVHHSPPLAGASLLYPPDVFTIPPERGRNSFLPTPAITLSGHAASLPSFTYFLQSRVENNADPTKPTRSRRPSREGSFHSANVGLDARLESGQASAGEQRAGRQRVRMWRPAFVPRQLSSEGIKDSAHDPSLAHSV